VDTTLDSAVSALTSQSSALATISANLANSNTTGYKAVSTQFLSLLNDATGSSNSSTGSSTGGVSTVARQNVTLGGNLTSSTTSTDMAISGNGFFVVSDASGTHDYYTRDGEFSTDSTGNLYLNGTSYYLQGWPTDSSGSVTSTALQTINVDKLASTSKATTTESLTANLPDEAQSDVNTLSYTNDSGNSETLNYSWASTGTNTNGDNTYLVTVTPSNSSVTLDDGTTSGASALTYTVDVDSTGAIVSVTGTTGNAVGYTGTDLPTTITASDNTSAAIDTSSETWSAVEAKSGFSKSSSVTVYDSNGTAQAVPVTWTAAGDNSWIMTVSTPTSANGSTTTGTLSDASGATTSSYSYEVSFNSDGSLASTTPLSEMNGSSISTAPTDSSGNPTVNVYGWSYTNSAGKAVTAGASSVSLNLGTVGKTDGLTQYNLGSSSPSVTMSATQDGYALGTLQSVAVNNGEVVATYSNGQSVPIYKVAVATFRNADGLNAMSSNVYDESGTSGTSSLNVSGSGGAGTVEGNYLESSTVDTSTEFSDMITCQQAYSAGSQIITTSTKLFESLMTALP
jgi:flagellar hook-basal body protein